MRTLPQRMAPLNQLPLFAWADEHNVHSLLPLRMGRKLQHRFGLSISTANLVAELAGYKAMESGND